MVILIYRTYETITPESAEDGETADSGFLSENEPCTFRELVSLLEGGEPSSYPRAGLRDWVTHDAGTDYRTGEETRNSIHYSRDNPPRAEKYWLKALHAAGCRT